MNVHLSKGKGVIGVDERHYPWISLRKWYLASNGRVMGWDKTFVKPNGKKGKLTYLSHEIWIREYGSLPEKPLQVCYINGDYLDNRVENFVARTFTVANQLQGKHDGGTIKVTSKHTGVFWNTKAGKWGAQIRANNTQHYLGLHIDENAAARAYNKAAIEYHGEQAQLNEIPEEALTGSLGN